ncbi:carboxypeptidase-like regulatory domain-containing protein [Nocardiopsis salina]|uniref:carboxypeptidase-like regulatory domain-containing protein n=1 Tax=Nocardiopsis salina TaxID=245836 RepID=UPI000348A88C|nr:carboxypeptidase-like regulatory domain-containing protein [Nocardiopsis salina]
MAGTRSRTRPTILVGGAAALVLAWPGPAHAHGVELDHDGAEAVVVEARYDTGEPMAEAQVSVYAPDGTEQPWATGTVDDRGQYLFAPDEPGTWEVEVRQAGHGDTLEVEVADEEPEGDDEAGEQPEQNGGPGPEGEREDDDGTEPAGSSDRAGTGSGGNMLQTVLMGALAVWGLVGTALFFLGRKRA